MANENVVDELVVRLRLDAESYDKAQAAIDAKASGTEKKEKDKDAKRKGRDRDQESRWKSMTSSAKALGIQLAAVAGFVTGVGAAIIGSLSGLNTFELGLRRQAVSTGLSNREMQAWGSTARRLGADADAGAQSIADLAREQKQFNLTGDAPTLQALARIGVRVGANVPVQDMLGQAQQIYRNAPTAQKGQIEAQLSAQGVSGDLILMIKSERDARQAYTQSLTEATAENKQALSDFNDALASAKSNAVSVANTLATILQPGIKSAGEWLGKFAADASRFSERVVAAGGGVDGVVKVLNEESPVLGSALKKFGDVVDVVRFGLSKLGELLAKLTGGGWSDAINNKIAAEVAKPDHNPLYGALAALQGVGKKIAGTASSVWGETVDNAHAEGYNTLGPGGPPGPATAAGGPSGAKDIMGTLITKYGLSVGDAAAVAANLQSESGGNPAAFNPAGGGQGAAGLAQWRGPRMDAFRARYGINPNQATTEQQLEFMMTDPTERALLNKALAAGSDATSKGVGFSQIYEAHGNFAEDARRGTAAAALAAQYGTGTPSNVAGGSPVTITGPVTVVANSPQELATGLQRQSGVQNYNSAVR